MGEKEYNVTVNFTISYSVEVVARSREEAYEKAEDYMTEDFRHDLDNGYLGVSDFSMDSEIVK